MINEKNYVKLTEKDRCHFSNAPEAAKWLLGKALCRKSENGDVVRCIITETEAYTYEDETCYGHSGKTRETAPLFEKQGTCCIFSAMVLISCNKEGRSDNVLIRAAGNDSEFFSGPYNLYTELGLDKSFTGTDLLTSDTLWLETDGTERQFCTTERKNLSKDTKPEFKNLKQRYIIL